MSGCATIPRLCGILALLASSALAQGPHEIALLINQNSADSMEIGHTYAQLRRVPPSNIIYLDIPATPNDLFAGITPANFKKFILEPASKTIQERRLSDHILAWVYSAGFPVRVTTEVPISLTGATFTRGEFPAAEMVKQGRYASPFFRGPMKADEPGRPSASIQEFAVAFLDKMPLPAMMLGYTGARGLSVDTIIDGLRRAASADGTRPRDPVYFHISEDVRSRARRWQFDAAVPELAGVGIPATISSNRPPENLGLSGLMMGAANAGKPWGRLQPGSLADNLTSLGAYFHTYEQTRISYWLAHGAAASAGTVAEPYAIWTKFPNARLFFHYASGCTALESYLQSVASPLQLLPVGDPLCKPWGESIPLTLISMDDDKKPVSGIASFIASSLMIQPGMSYLFLLDGRALPVGGSKPGLQMDTQLFDDGYHELEAVAYSPGPIRSQGHAQLGFTINNHGQSANLQLADGVNATLDLYRPFDIHVSASAGATGLAISVNERVLWQGAASLEEQTVSLSAQQIGPGPAQLQATAYFPQTRQARSKLVPITIARLNKAPSAPEITAQKTADGTTHLTATSSDFDRDKIQITWFANLLATASPKMEPADALQVSDAKWTLSNTGGTTVAVLPAILNATHEVVAALQISEYDKPSGHQVGGIVFDYKDDANYSCFGWNWENGGWVLGRITDGKFARYASFGMPLNPRHTYTIGLRQEKETLTAFVDDTPVVRTGKLQLRGILGVSGGAPSLMISKLAVSPPPGWPDANSPTAPLRDTTTPLLIRAADQAASSWSEYNPKKSD